MEKAFQDLIEISQFYGRNNEFVIGGGGNTSYKDENYLYVKASGTMLGNITEKGFVKIDSLALKSLANKVYPDDVVLRDQLNIKDMLNCCRDNELNLRPSVEAPLHQLIQYKFVVHTHPTYANALLCSNEAEKKVKELFPESVLYVKYTDPGYILFKAMEQEIVSYRKKFNKDPQIIMVQNHGVFVSANSVEEIKQIYNELIETIKGNIKKPFLVENLPVDRKANQIIPALRMLLSNDVVKVAKVRNNSLIGHFVNNSENAELVILPFTPDIIVYCKARPLYISSLGSNEEIIDEFITKLADYQAKYGYSPKIILINQIGIIAVDENAKMTELLLEVFEDLMKISFLSQSFGGPHFMTEEQIAFIENWESENYRHKMSVGLGLGRVQNKIAIITGAAQGFGSGIAEEMFKDGANVVIADLNEQKGNEFAIQLNQSAKNNKAIFVKTDVSNAESVQNLIFETVKEFGGLDVFISNAGILHAGGLDEMTPEKFELMTKVNYSGYFISAKYASEVMKLQSKYKKDYFTDIIQINSKSGLRGSKKNFAYAGGKFGGIGLTQSFALELMEFNIKVNSICPGNFFDGPLWSDPENGLFVQYLKAGKVPGAKTIEDVKHFYAKQVPARRGCTVKDVLCAVYYLIEQEYETGQALPVTGGQVMLN